MTIKLTFTSEKDLEKNPATFKMLSSFPRAEATFGLGRAGVLPLYCTSPKGT